LVYPPLLDRIPYQDERSRAYGVREYKATANRVPRSFRWACATFLNQLREGKCVGHGFAHDAAARPVVHPVVQADADKLYHLAQSTDPWHDQPHEGTTVLDGAKAYVALGYATGYRWAFGLADFILTLGYNGPAVLGLDWTEGQLEADDQGFIHVHGETVGGHCILATAVELVWKPGTTAAMKREPNWLEHLDLELSFATLHNSWGQEWGEGGVCYMSLADLGELLARRGEVCVPIGRK
jgi:hypothetical protein